MQKKWLGAFLGRLSKQSVKHEHFFWWRRMMSKSQSTGQVIKDLLQQKGHNFTEGVI